MKCKHEGCMNLSAKKRRECHTCHTLKKKYGINTPKRDSLLEKQDSKCLCCNRFIKFNNEKTIMGTIYNNKHKAVVDHCHSTGYIRGIICAACNSMLGNAYDSTQVLTNAINYLEQFSSALREKKFSHCEDTRQPQ